MLVRARKRAAAGGGELRLVIRDASLLRGFAVTGIDRMFPIFPSLAEALALGPHAAPPVVRPRHDSLAVSRSALAARPAQMTGRHGFRVITITP